VFLANFHNIIFYSIFLSEDDKVSLDELQEKIAEFEDFVQSTDVAAMQSAPLIGF
jgi:translation elongation factor EF-1beta